MKSDVMQSIQHINTDHKEGLLPYIFRFSHECTFGHLFYNFIYRCNTLHDLPKCKNYGCRLPCLCVSENNNILTSVCACMCVCVCFASGVGRGRFNSLIRDRLEGLPWKRMQCVLVNQVWDAGSVPVVPCGGSPLNLCLHLPRARTCTETC